MISLLASMVRAMADFWSDEWFAAVNEAAAVLTEVGGVSFSFDVEVAESAQGKVRAHGEVVNGRLVEFTNGKFVPETKGDKADVSFVGKAKRLMPIVRGEQPPLVAYMMGELKVDGAYERVVDHLANQCDPAAFEAFRAAVDASTDEAS